MTVSSVQTGGFQAEEGLPHSTVKRLRGLGSDLGSAIKGFRKSMQDDGDAPEKEKDEAGDTAPGQRSEQADEASNGSHPKP